MPEFGTDGCHAMGQRMERIAAPFESSCDNLNWSGAEES
ncbi:hypothetical protein SBA5_70120 [Candidatus Sulfotelmatomonas gaucii]|uniref:Uncharacterized protein n=1 Tax=Candidatus Sulfuritelmatomonas gaucii TaxID=2043161 RepID=A0A2N9M0P2_9BACT|nr:hypothetical protein SBA5_70120 [Candidatus Sulfotelmatomonas gaucii]